MLLLPIDSSSTSALTYSDNVNMQFTLNPTLSINVSGDLTIDNLTPGNYSDSNIITITTSTNNNTGFSLYANVGNSTDTNPSHNNTNLTHTNGTNTFTNLSTNKSSLSNFDANSNTWGYSYSVDNGTNWISGDYDSNDGSPDTGYNGLPLYSTGNGIKLASTDTSSTNTLKFKIGARSTNTQAAGEYTNIINFYATAHNTPTTFYEAFASAGKSQHNGYYKMQDMTTSICSAVEVLDEDSQTQLIDTRDNKLYWVAKLQDGHCWMTQNLDLDLDENVALTSENTDLNEYNQNGYLATDGYSCSNQNTTTNCTASGEVIFWRPERSTINAITTESTSLTRITEWNNQQQDPYSVDPGNWYWKGVYYDSFEQCPSTNTTNPDYIACDYISKRTKDDNGGDVINNWSSYFSTTPFSSINGSHGHVGNYYNWASSIASNNAIAYTSSTIGDTAKNPKNSICSANWRLPIIASYTSNSPYAAGDNEFYNLAYYYGVPNRNSDQKPIEPPLYFTRTGAIWSNAQKVAGSEGYYWSSTVAINTRANYVTFRSNWVYPQSETNRQNGLTLRCLAK